MNVAQTEPADDPRLGIGGNSPPPPTPYETACEEIESLYGEAALWLDGARVESQGVADGLAKLIAMLREAVKKADAARTAENKPFDEGKAAVQAKYAPLIADTKTQKGKAILAIEVCKNALAPWLDAIDRAQREAAEAARHEAAEKARIAQDAIRAADFANLAEREAAEELVKDAKRADAQANRIERATATAATGGRAIGLRTTWTATVVDDVAFARYVWERHRSEMNEFLAGLAQRLARAGGRDLPGCEISEQKSVA